MKKIFVAGHHGMVGSAIVRKLSLNRDVEFVFRSHQDLDYTNQAHLSDLFESEEIDEVYLASAKVGGIFANNTYPAEFIYDNLLIECNIIHAAHLAGVQKLLFLGSSCIYPRDAAQPIREESLMTGPLEPTNEPYAVAKIAGIKLCESYNRQYGRDYRSVMPTNLYGPNDNFHPQNGHVLPALLHRFHSAIESNEPEVVIWGSGSPMREFMHVDDMASACVHIMNLPVETYNAHTKPMMSHINIGTGVDCSINELALSIAEVTGYKGNVAFDTSKPDGTPRKLLDVSKLEALGFEAKISLKEGLKQTYEWYLANRNNLRMK